ncbi:MAG: murein L,D-transpeptidase family protein [Methylococcaceae bacterium]
MKRVSLLGFLLLSFTWFSMPVSADGAWLLIDTKKLKLEVIKGNKTIAVMNNIAIGRGGAGLKQYLGDDVTPLGSYKIGWINKQSRFYRFYGFTYPSVENANEALLGGLLSKEKHAAIIKAHNNNKTPPQNTSIGGQIGIHGLGAADENIHTIMNWTHGCIALTNEQIDILDQWVRKGTRVKIK